MRKIMFIWLLNPVSLVAFALIVIYKSVEVGVALALALYEDLL